MQRITLLASLVFTVLSTTVNAAACVQGPTYEGCMIAVRLEDQRAAGQSQDAIPAYSVGQGVSQRPSDSKKPGNNATTKGASKQKQQLPPAETSAEKAVSPFSNVAVAWNEKGYWISRVGQTEQDALASATDACSAQFGNCVDAGISVSDGQLACYAIFKSGENLYGARDLKGNANQAMNKAMASCKKARQRNCVLEIASCNDHP